MANLTLRYLDELSYVLNSRKHLASQAKASSVGDLLNAEEERFTPRCIRAFACTFIGGSPSSRTYYIADDVVQGAMRGKDTSFA
ncbi:unnamed protein product [Colias eurytheme]|nr:unnamed protein product [Colias eurytheme]